MNCRQMEQRILIAGIRITCLLFFIYFAFNISLSDTEYKVVEEKATQLQDYMNKYFKAEEIEVEAEEVVATGNINGLDF